MFLSYTNSRSINSREMTWFLCLAFVSKILFADISRYVSSSGTCAYMQTAWNALLAFLLFKILSRCLKGEDLLYSTKLVFGSKGQKAVGFLVSLFLLFNAGIMVRVYSDIIGSIVLPDASDFFIVAFMAVAICVACFSGVCTIVSYAYGAGIVVVATLAVILLLNTPNYHITNIYPLFGNGVSKILSDINGLSVYSDVLLIFLVSPYLKEHASVEKAGTKAILISGAVVTLTTFLYILSVPYPSSASFTLPILEIAFSVNLDVVFQRAEGLFLFMWILSGFTVISAYICFSISSIEKSFGFSDRRALVGVCVFISITLALFLGNSADSSKIYDMFYKIFTTLAFLLPAIIFAVCRFRHKENL